MNGPSSLEPQKELAAVCGLFCPGCSLYIATREDRERLQRLARQFQLSEEEIKCFGCHSQKRGPYCQSCKMVACAEQKGIGFCSECGEFPCEELKAFQTAMPHRAELWNSLARIKEAGYPQWFAETLADYSCPQCRTINSAYDLKCRQCGVEPSCAFISRNKPAVLQYLAQQQKKAQ